MNALSLDQIRARMTPAAPTLGQCEEVVRCVDRRRARADAKFFAAVHERAAAKIAQCHARAERAHCIANTTSDQLVML